MSEKPIIFSSEMVRAILAGRKSETRRVIKPGKRHYTQYNWYGKHPCGGWWACDVDPIQNNIPSGDNGFPCPHGQPGDRLWVRETWRMLLGPQKGFIPEDLQFSKNVLYGADHPALHTGHWDSDIDEFVSDIKIWRPSIFMPRWASRITLEITGVRVERVQDISEEDAVREGIANGAYAINPKSSFSKLWDSINLKRGFGWDANPFVWVIEFRKLN